MPIFGWDASDYDWSRGPMDLRAARADGIDFFTHKSSEGTSVRHARFGEAMRRARDAGVPFLGAYHVVRSPANAADEVDYCLATVNAAAPWWKDFAGWFWQIDLERWPYDAVPASEGENFADIIEQRTGREAAIYASRGQYGDSLQGTSHPLWNANYGTNAAAPFRELYAGRGGDKGSGWAAYSGVTPAIWQYGSRAVIGRQGTCDANAFRGSVADFARLIGATTSGDDDDMHTLMRFEKDSAVFLTDGKVGRWVKTPEEIADLANLGNLGRLSVAPGGVQVVGRRELVGVIVGEVPPGWEAQALQPAPPPAGMSDVQLGKFAKMVAVELGSLRFTPSA